MPNKKTSTERQRVLYEQIHEKHDRQCAECGFDDPRALIVSDTHRERTKGGLGYLYAVLNDETGRYRLLCANHMMIANQEAGANRRLVGRTNGRRSRRPN